MAPTFQLLQAVALTEPRVDAGFDLGRYLVLVCGILFLLFAVAWGLRRLLATTIRERASKRSLSVVDVLPLGGRRQLTVVRCYDRTFVLGMGDKDVSLVAELDPVTAEESAKITPGVNNPDAETRRFESLVESARKKLDNRLRQGGKKAAPAEEGFVA